MKKLNQIPALLKVVLMLILLLGVGVEKTLAQTTSPTPPQSGETVNKVCISQQDANSCFDCFKESVALRDLVKALEDDKSLSVRQVVILEKKIDDLESNYTLTVAEHKKESDALRKLIEKLSKKQISILYGLIKFRW